ncbi:MAG: hypothetical protein J7J46_10780, partial [Candidatus Desulfofervidus sp.]|nr:hypothetical protein [Candidatus Desulfofervidus sp.]
STFRKFGVIFVSIFFLFRNCHSHTCFLIAYKDLLANVGTLERLHVEALRKDLPMEILSHGSFL